MLAQLPLPFATARGLKKLRNTLRPEAEFLIEEEQKLIKQCSGVMDGAKVNFPSPDAGRRYMAGLAEILGQEIEVDIEPVKISADTEGLRVSAEDLENLENLVDFIDSASGLG